MDNVILHFENSASWTSDGDVHATGHAFADGRVHSPRDLCVLLSGVEELNALSKLVSGLNGFFSLAKRSLNEVYAAVDFVRSIPLFYTVMGERFYLSDSATWLEETRAARENDPIAKAEFLLTGYVTGSATLNPHIKQLQAGEALIARRKALTWKVETVRYFEFWRTGGHQGGVRNLSALQEVFTRSIGRLIARAQGAQIAVPLSGGFDSRLIAAGLKLAGYPRVLTFTYGKAYSSETRLSREIADTLGFPWHFVPYDPPRWRSWFLSGDRESYFAQAHNLVSVPHIQDWLAVRSLRESGLLAREAIIVPGHTGDFISGGHTPLDINPRAIYPAKEIAESIFRLHYRLWPSSAVLGGPERLLCRILNIEGLDAANDLTGEEIIAHHDRWNWQERQAKFIVNSLRVYDYFDLGWWMPLWDAEFIRYWADAPLEHRYEQTLYKEFVVHIFTSVAGWSPRKAERTDRDSFIPKLKDVLKRSQVLPLRQIRKLRNTIRGDSPYRKHPFAWFGMMPYEAFKRTYDGTQSINSFLAAYIAYGDWRIPPHSGNRPKNPLG